VSSHTIENPNHKRVLNVKHIGKKFLCILSVLCTHELAWSSLYFTPGIKPGAAVFSKVFKGGRALPLYNGPSPSLLLVKSCPDFAGCASTSM
jgi:hypothetical protein